MLKGICLLLVLSECCFAQTKGGGFFFYDRNQFTATGKWIPSDPKDKPAYPTETEIDCFKSSMSCVEATGDYYMAHPHVTITYLKVVKWDSDGLIATNSSAICMTNTVLVSFAEQSLTETDSLKKLDDKKKEACKFFGAEKTIHSTFILRNSERWNKEREQDWLHPKSN